MQTPHPEPDPRELLRRDFNGDAEYGAIRQLWKQHSIAEDNRDLDGLIATLTDDCVYEILGTEHRWVGHDGARAFYTELLGAFPDIVFSLTDITIGPQGVTEMAKVVGTHSAPWLGDAPTGEQLHWRVAIFFPWDVDRRLFRGERVLSTAPTAVPSTAA